MAHPRSIHCPCVTPRHRVMQSVCTALALAVQFVLALHTAASAEPRRAPNIILILADDLGYGDLGCYGQRRIRTPHLDRMAAEGLRFTQCYAGSTVCAPSRYVLMTGQHCGKGLIRGNGGQNLRPEDITVAEVLKSVGYATGMVGKWGLGHEGSTGVPRRKGFDEFFGFLDHGHAHNYYPSFLYRNEERVRLKNRVPKEGPAGQGVADLRVEYAGDLFAAEAISFVERHKDRPFFLYFAPTVPHANNEAGKQGMEVPDEGPYAKEPWPEQERRFAAMISRLDADIGRLLAKIKDLGLDENTVVFFSSDNGPHKEGGHDPTYFDSNGPLKGGKRDLYDGGIRVPLLARWPGTIRPGVSNHVCWFADFLPTAAELAGAKAAPAEASLSFAPALRGERGQRQHDWLYWEFYEGRGGRAVRLGDWKAVATSFDGPLELYDLRTDIAEERNVAMEHPQVVERMKSILAQAHVPSPHWKINPGGKKRPSGTKQAPKPAPS